MVKHTKRTARRTANRRRARRTTKRGGDASSSPKTPLTPRTPLTPGKTQNLINDCKVHYENLADALKKNDTNIIIETVMELCEFLIKNPLPFLKNYKFMMTFYEKILEIESRITADDKNINKDKLAAYRTILEKLKIKVNRYSYHYNTKEIFQI